MTRTLTTTPAAHRHSPFAWGMRTYIMGIVNLSPDSFSSDGLHSAESAVAQAKYMATEGADIIDVGGESTHPGATPISAAEEIERIVPVITRLNRDLEVPISVDTYKYAVAQAAIAAGADILNDVRGLKDNTQLANLAAEHGLSIIVTANERGKPLIGDIMAEITSDLSRATQCCREAGVPLENIIVDPGLGFGKTSAQDLEIIRRLGKLKILGCPILLGPSRKSFIGHTLGLPENERLEGTAAAVALGIAHGADIFRVHDVKEMVRVARLCDAVVREQPQHDAPPAL